MWTGKECEVNEAELDGTNVVRRGKDHPNEDSLSYAFLFLIYNLILILNNIWSIKELLGYNL